MSILIVGCSAQKQPVFMDYPPAVTNQIVMTTDVNGYKYQLVQSAKQDGGVISDAELWERVFPEDTNHWYEMTLASKQNTNSPPMFNSLSR